jgi:hypothetical protein
MAREEAASLVAADSKPRLPAPSPVHRRALPRARATAPAPAAWETTAQRQMWARCMLLHQLDVLNLHATCSSLLFVQAQAAAAGLVPFTPLQHHPHLRPLELEPVLLLVQ